MGRAGDRGPKGERVSLGVIILFSICHYLTSLFEEHPDVWSHIFLNLKDKNNECWLLGLEKQRTRDPP